MSNFSIAEIENISPDSIDANGIEFHRDGGTLGFKTELDGQEVSIYLDRRMNSETRDMFYADAYPESEGSRVLGMSDKLKATLDTALDAGK